MDDTTDLLDRLLEEALTPPSGIGYSPRQPAESAEAAIDDILNLGNDAKVEHRPQHKQLPPLPLHNARIMSASDQELDLLTPIATEADDTVVPFTAAESSPEAVPTVDALLQHSEPGAVEERIVSPPKEHDGQAEGTPRFVRDLWPMDVEEDENTPSVNESRSDQPPSVMELAGPVANDSAPRDKVADTDRGPHIPLPPLDLVGGPVPSLPPIQEVSTGRTSSAGPYDSERREAVISPRLLPQQAAPSIPVFESIPAQIATTPRGELPPLGPMNLGPVRDWLKRMGQVRPQAAAITEARTGGPTVLQPGGSQSITGHSSTVLYCISVGRVTAPPISNHLAEGVVVSYRLYVTLFHLRSQLLISRTAVSPKVDAPAGHDFNIDGSFWYHTGSSSTDPQVGVILELALSLPDGDRLSAGWSVVPAGHDLSGGAVLLKGSPRLLPFMKREVIGAFASTQSPTGSLVGLATAGRLEVSFRSLSGEDPQANIMRRMLPSGYVAAVDTPVGCLQSSGLRRAEVFLGRITADLGSHHTTAELRDALRFAVQDFSQRFKPLGGHRDEKVELSNLCTVVVYAHNGLQQITPECTFHMQGDSSGNPVLVSTVNHTVDMILDDGCALVVELHYHLTGEGSGSVPLCVAWCLLLPPQLDPLTECIVLNQPHNSVLLRSRLMKGPGETLAGRRVWAGSPTGTDFSIEFAMTGEAYASWLGERQKVLHVERLKQAPLSAAQPLPAMRSPREAPVVTQTPRALLPPVPNHPYQEPIRDMAVEGPEVPAPAMLFETRSLEAPAFTPSAVPNGTSPSPPRTTDPPFAPALEPPHAPPVEARNTPPVEPARTQPEASRVPAIEQPGPLVAEPLHAPDVQQPSIPNLDEKPEPMITAVSPTAPATPPGRGEVKGDRNARSPSLRDANTQYDVCITEAAEPELIPVKASASTGAASPSAGFEIGTQAGRQPDPPPARDMSPADKASAVAAGLITASTAEQEDLAALDWQLEENDHLTNDEITLAVVGWRPLEGARRPGSKKVYFSAKFYTFPLQTTDAAELPHTACHSALSSSRTGQ
ncbi:hypothetical protein FOL46_000451, partial [Perkinsus olseni]